MAEDPMITELESQVAQLTQTTDQLAQQLKDNDTLTTTAALRVKDTIEIGVISSGVGGVAPPLEAGSTRLWNDGTWLHMNTNLDGTPLPLGVHVPGPLAVGALAIEATPVDADTIAPSLTTGSTLLWNDGTWLHVNQNMDGSQTGIQGMQISGALGIGGDATIGPLHVRGGEVHSSGDRAGFSFFNRQTQDYVRVPNAGERWVWYATGGAARLWSGDDKLSVAPNGNVGIGIAQPQYKLEVAGDIGIASRIWAAGERLYLLNKGGTFIAKTEGGNGNLTVEGVLTVVDHLEVAGSVNVGKDVIVGSGRLHIDGPEKLFLLNKEGAVVSKAWRGNGSLTVEGTLTVGEELVLGATRTSIRGFDDNGEHSIRTDGNVDERWMTFKRTARDYQYDSTSIMPPDNIPVTQTITVNLERSIEFAVPTVGAVSYQQSDARLKASIRPLSRVLAGLEHVHGVNFNWANMDNAQDQESEYPSIGVLAQEVEAVFPELVVSYGDQGYKAVNYSGLTAVLIEAVKELKAECDALRQQIRCLTQS